jgi:hypothetical protein
MLLLRIALLIFAAPLVIACGAPGGAVRVADTNARYEFPEQGISVLPPIGPRWWAVPGSTFSPNHVIVFGKPLTEKYPETPVELRTLVAGVVVYEFSEVDVPADVTTAEDFKRRFDAGFAEGLSNATGQPPLHFVSADEQVDRSPGAECVRYDEIVEDKRVPRFEGSTFIEHRRGFRCLHPYRKGFIVEFAYSERHLAGEPEIAQYAEVEPFMKSILFAPPSH